MRRSVGFLIVAVVGISACGARLPSASGAASSAAVTTASASPAPSPEYAQDSYPSAPRLNNGFLGNGVHGTPLLVSGIGVDQGTWYWDGATWVHTTSQFASYFITQPTFDPQLGKSIVLAGGATGDPVTTWAWNGSAWSGLAGGPSGGGAAELAFDGAINQLVTVLGDYTTGKTATWLFDGAQWQPAGSGPGPTARANAGFAYDPGSRQLVLFGGISYLGASPRPSVADTWTWDGKAWTERQPAHSPPAGWNTLAYDPDSHQLILVNEARINELSLPTEISMWSWDGADWNRLSPHRLPAIGLQPSATYDAANHQLILFETTLQPGPGIEGSQTWAYANDTWTRVG
jgi:hypothetical protein